MAKQNPNVTQEWCFVKNMWTAGSVKGLSLELFQEQLTLTIFSKKGPMLDLRLGSKYASEKSYAEQLLSEKLHEQLERYL